MRLDDGGRYLPSKAQLWLWEKWCDFWDTVDRIRREAKADLYCLYNGDAVDGPHHHQTTQSISGNEEVQAYLASRVFGVPRALKPARQFVVRGTEVHVGPSASSEENLARWMQAEKDPITETWSSWQWRLDIHGVRIDAAHHTNMGRVPWTQANAANQLAARILMEHARYGLPHPHLAFRAHVHNPADSFKAQPVRAIILPPWQLKTGFGHRVATDKIITPIGGAWAVIQPDGTFTADTKEYKPDPPPIWKAA